MQKIEAQIRTYDYEHQALSPFLQYLRSYLSTPFWTCALLYFPSSSDTLQGTFGLAAVRTLTQPVLFRHPSCRAVWGRERQCCTHGKPLSSSQSTTTSPAWLFSRHIFTAMSITTNSSNLDLITLSTPNPASFVNRRMRVFAFDHIIDSIHEYVWWRCSCID